MDFYTLGKKRCCFPLPTKGVGFLQEHSRSAHALKCTLCDHSTQSSLALRFFTDVMVWLHCNIAKTSFIEISVHSKISLTVNECDLREEPKSSTVHWHALTFRRWPVCIRKCPQLKPPPVVRKLHGTSLSQIMKTLNKYLVQGCFHQDRWEVASHQCNPSKSNFHLGFAHKKLKTGKTSFKEPVP